MPRSDICLLAFLYATAASFAGCSGTANGVDAPTAATRSAISPGPVSTFAILARHGASLDDRSSVSGGSVGVGASGAGTLDTFIGGSDARIAVGKALIAPAVVLRDRTVTGDVATNTLRAPTSVTIGTLSAFSAPPAPPVPSPVAAGAIPVVVAAGQTRTLGAGQFGSITIHGTLNLSGGLYQFRSLNLGNDARVVAQAPSVVRIATGLTALDRVQVSVAEPRAAGDLVIESSGTVDATGDGILFGNDAHLTAMFVANSAFRAGDRLTASGAIGARDVVVGHDARIAFDTGFACMQDADCGDGNACTADSCVDTTCQHTRAPACNATDVAVGSEHACAVLIGGRVSCWGDNNAGELGDGTTTERLTPVAAQGIVGAVGLAAGRLYTCALLGGSGAVECWGFNFFGQLGDGTQTDRHTPVATHVLGSAVAITAGFNHACAVLSDGSAACWGGNELGQLGDGTTNNALIPTAVHGLTGPVTAISGGTAHTCALLKGGTVQCWGWNAGGQLGDGTITDSLSPVTVVGLTGPATAISTMSDASCALLVSGGVECWGNGAVGQLGNGISTVSPTPVPVVGLTNVIGLSRGDGLAQCALLGDRSIACWGQGPALGNGSPSSSLVPVAVTGIHSALAVAQNLDNGCAVLLDGTVSSWGANTFGEIGDGTTIVRLTPVTVQFP